MVQFNHSVVGSPESTVPGLHPGLFILDGSTIPVSFLVRGIRSKDCVLLIIGQLMIWPGRPDWNADRH